MLGLQCGPPHWAHRNFYVTLRTWIVSSDFKAKWHVEAIMEELGIYLYTEKENRSMLMNNHTFREREDVRKP